MISIQDTVDQRRTDCQNRPAQFPMTTIVGFQRLNMIYIRSRLDIAEASPNEHAELIFAFVIVPESSKCYSPIIVI